MARFLYDRAAVDGFDLVAGVVVGGGRERWMGEDAPPAPIEALVLPPDRGAVPLHRGGSMRSTRVLTAAKTARSDVAAARFLTMTSPNLASAP